MENEQKLRKLLIVERKLISNRGHHHTQIDALKSLLPVFSPYIVAGEGYDDFMGEAAGIIPTKGLKLTRLNARARHGTLSQRISARINLLMAGRISGPASAYGQVLSDICRRHNFGPDDVIVIPTAELDSLESARELSAIMGSEAPLICLRFLGPELGDRDPPIRDRRLKAATVKLPPNIRLFSETEELAHYLNTGYGIPVTGRFFMPCTIGPGGQVPKTPTENKHFRVGVFGAPRVEKGSARIASIALEVARLSESSPGRPIEFVIQGSASDFGSDGVYGSLREFFDGKDDVWVTHHDDRLSPVEFDKLFNSVDAILIPYERSLYALQGSGVIQDAVAALKPIVHTEGISMAGFLSHGNAIAAATDRDFAIAIKQIAADPSAFSKGTAKAATYYSAELQSSPLFKVVGG